MCVAIVKPVGAKVPSLKTLKKCWDANPDGAGVAYNAEGGGIAIRKGLMKWKEFEKFFKRFKNAKHLTIFIHFRIKTHGAVSAGNTHPFPLSADPATLRQCVGVFDSVMMHNGVLPLHPTIDDGSDTMELAKLLSTFSSDDVPHAGELLEPFLGSDKVAIWQKGCEPIMLGDWRKKDGCFYSNFLWECYGSLKGFGNWFDNWKSPHETKADDPVADEYDNVNGDWYYDTPGGFDLQTLRKGRCPYCDNEVIRTKGGNYACSYCGTMWMLNN